MVVGRRLRVYGSERAVRVPVKGVETGRVSLSTHHGFHARTPDLMDAPSLNVRLVR